MQRSDVEGTLRPLQSSPFIYRSRNRVFRLGPRDIDRPTRNTNHPRNGAEAKARHSLL